MTVTRAAGAAARAASPIVVLGDVVDDILVAPAGAIRPESDVPARIRIAPGGSAANVAAWLGALGEPVVFRGRVGAGDAARHTAALARHGVDARIDEDAAEPTGRIVVLVEGGRRTFLTDGGASRTLGPGALTDEILAGAAAVHLTAHSLLDAERRAQGRDLIDRAHTLGVPVVVDPSSAGFLRDIGTDAFLDAVRGCRILLPNAAEAEVLTGLADPPRAARALTEVAETVVVTCGADGAWVAVRGAATTRIPAEPATVIDTTGAGDAFAAGVHRAARRGTDPVTAAREAAAVAARAVARHGARPAGPSVDRSGGSPV